jgi:hypothetical protein
MFIQESASPVRSYSTISILSAKSRSRRPTSRGDGDEESFGEFHSGSFREYVICLGRDLEWVQEVRYSEKEIEVIVAYDLYKDIAYVYLLSELKQKETVSVSDDAAERWDKL